MRRRSYSAAFNTGLRDLPPARAAFLWYPPGPSSRWPVLGSGARSAMATQAFRAAGWDAYNMSGGITAWADRGLPLEPEDGRVAEH